MSVIAESEHSAKENPSWFAVLPRVPFTWVRPTAALSDALLTIAASIVSDLLYCRFITDSEGNLESSFAFGLAVLVYFIALNGYRRNYATDALSDVHRQVREVTVIWCLVFLLLASVAFMLKIGANFSRGTTFDLLRHGMGLSYSIPLVSCEKSLAGAGGRRFCGAKNLDRCRSATARNQQLY